ncbi:hypothetical protein [uncultured Campylobacter sp.]|uniref:hypothetical protein n=1 Tax=uncultured Campylobacter sp. TaxID=218934 RepID=UPI00261C4F46|nr:hypothetical protein [uncultured Campylobacter sp.]
MLAASPYTSADGPACSLYIGRGAVNDVGQQHELVALEQNLSSSSAAASSPAGPWQIVMMYLPCS